MNRTELVAKLNEIRTLREQILVELADLTEADFATPVLMQRWDDTRRVLLRFGDHMREHASQLEGIRTELGKAPTPPQRMLAEAEVAWGKLLAATIGLSDDDLGRIPETSGWSVETLLAHVLQGEQNYINALRKAKE